MKRSRSSSSTTTTTRETKPTMRLDKSETLASSAVYVCMYVCVCFFLEGRCVPLMLYLRQLVSIALRLPLAQRDGRKKNKMNEHTHTHTHALSLSPRVCLSIYPALHLSDVSAAPLALRLRSNVGAALWPPQDVSHSTLPIVSSKGSRLRCCSSQRMLSSTEVWTRS